MSDLDRIEREAKERRDPILDLLHSQEIDEPYASWREAEAAVDELLAIAKEWEHAARGLAEERHKTLELVCEERDQARALAKQLAEALMACAGIEGSVWNRNVLAVYEEQSKGWL